MTDASKLVAELRDTMKRQEWVPAILGIRAADLIEAQAKAIREALEHLHRKSALWGNDLRVNDADGFLRILSAVAPVPEEEARNVE